MNRHINTGASFGLTSGVITTLGLMVGLHSGTQSTMVVVGGIVTIAIADAMSDALGIHIAEESKGEHTPAEIWLTTVAAFLAKLLMALTFLVPILLFDLGTAIVVGAVWGLTVIAWLSYRMARAQGAAPWKVIGEHVGITVLVIVLSHLVGVAVAGFFG